MATQLSITDKSLGSGIDASLAFNLTESNWTGFMNERRKILSENSCNKLERMYRNLREGLEKRGATSLLSVPASLINEIIDGMDQISYRTEYPKKLLKFHRWSQRQLAEEVLQGRIPPVAEASSAVVNPTQAAMPGEQVAATQRLAPADVPAESQTEKRTGQADAVDPYVQVSVRILRPLRKAVKMAALEHDCACSDVVEALIWQFLDELDWADVEKAERT